MEIADENESKLEGVMLPENTKMLKNWLLMSSKTKSGETSTEKLRMDHVVLLETPTPSQFQPRLQFYHFLPKSNECASFFNTFPIGLDP